MPIWLKWYGHLCNISILLKRAFKHAIISLCTLPGLSRYSKISFWNSRQNTVSMRQEDIPLEPFWYKFSLLRTYTSMFHKILIRLQSIKQCTYWLSNISLFTESQYVSFETKFTEKNRYIFPSGPELAKSEVCFKFF